uniref:ZP domain-containing protein n=1 Tax=Ascaris lumbricoides TaxID=6252 RepID=A0A0M3ID57_ASCLU
MPLQVLLVFLCVLSTIQSKVIGGPQIECSTNGVVIRLPMDEPFRGHIFIRGHYGDDQCHVDYRGKNETKPMIDISFDDCGMRRRRQTNPRGLSISSTLIVSFHPTFITYEDRAYQVECFYMEESRVVQSEFNVRCSLDDGIFPQIQYIGDLTAGVLSKAFKFADHSNIFFQCQIALTLKEKHDNGKCPVSNLSTTTQINLQSNLSTTTQINLQSNLSTTTQINLQRDSIDDSNGSCRVIRNALACMIAVSVASICGCLCSIVSYLFWRRSEHIHKTNFLSW